MATLRLYNMWYNPFGQRVRAALVLKNVKTEFIEQVPYDKTPEWLAISPLGIVPVIVHNGNTIYESSICIEYLDESFPGGEPLMPKDPFSRAKIRMWSDHISKKIVPSYFAVMYKPTAEEQNVAKGDLLNAVEFLSKAMNDGGPYFMGKQFGMVDIMLAPFAYRFAIVTKHYRDFDIPKEDRFVRYHTWWNAVQEVPCLKDTFPDKDKLIEFTAANAHGGSTSDIVKAVVGGKALP